MEESNCASGAGSTYTGSDSLVLFLFLVCIESEAAWLKKKRTTVTSASPTSCVVPKRYLEGVNSSLCKQGQPPYSDRKEKKNAKAVLSALPSHLGRNSHARSMLFSHHRILVPVAALPGWESTENAAGVNNMRMTTTNENHPFRTRTQHVQQN